MSVAHAQVLIPAVTKQPDAPWAQGNSGHGNAPQRQAPKPDFDTYYDENIQPWVAQIVAENKSNFFPIKTILFWGLLIIVILGGLAIGMVGPSNIVNSFAGLPSHGISFLLPIPLLLFKYRKLFIRGKNSRSGKSEKLRSAIIPQTFKYVNNDCSFNRSPSLSGADEDFLGINSSTNRVHCHDEVVGAHNGTSFKMMEIEIEKEVMDPKSRRPYYITVFNGIYLLLNVPKPFSGRVEIKRDSQKFLSAVTNVFSNMERVRLEDPKFEKEFQVYATDQVEARHLMTTTMMQSLNELRTLLGGKSLEGRFLFGQLALRIDCPHDLFEIDCGVGEEEYRDQAKKIISDLNSVFNAIDAMDLKQQGIV